MSEKQPYKHFSGSQKRKHRLPQSEEFLAAGSNPKQTKIDALFSFDRVNTPTSFSSSRNPSSSENQLALDSDLETEDLDPNLSLPLPRNNQLSHLELSEQSDSSMRIVEHHEHTEQGTYSYVLRVVK